MVYVANLQLYLKAMDTLDSTPIPGTDEGSASPFFSPDGQWIGFFSPRDRQLKKIAVSGGAPVTLSDIDNPRGSSAVWGTDDTIVWGQREGIMRVSANGGTPELLIAGGEVILRHPQMLPDGKSVLISRADPSGQVVVYSLESGEPKVLFAGFGAKYLSTGHIVYTIADVLFAVPFDLDTLEVVGGRFRWLRVLGQGRHSMPSPILARLFSFQAVKRVPSAIRLRWWLGMEKWSS